MNRQVWFKQPIKVIAIIDFKNATLFILVYYLQAVKGKGKRIVQDISVLAGENDTALNIKNFKERSLVSIGLVVTKVNVNLYAAINDNYAVKGLEMRKVHH